MNVKMVNNSWELITITSDKNNSGSDADVFVRIWFGSQVSNEVHLNPLDSFHDNVFQRSNFDNFSFQTTADTSETPSPTAIEFRHRGSDAWTGNKALLTERNTGEIYETRDGDFALDNASNITLPLTRCQKPLPENPRPTCELFSITVHTTLANNAGTNDTIFIKLVSYDGFSHTLHTLNTPVINDFKPGSQNLFEFLPERPLKKIAYVLLFKGSTDGWLMNSCRAASFSIITPDPYPDTTVFNPANVWLDSGVGYLNYHKFE